MINMLYKKIFTNKNALLVTIHTIIKSIRKNIETNIRLFIKDAEKLDS